MISEDQGKKLVQAARDIIRSRLEGKKPALGNDFIQEFSEKAGIFVTITIDGELRGCIGFPEPMHELHKALLEASQSAAFGDPRFPPLSKAEFEKIKVEVTVLSKPALIKVKEPSQYLKTIKIGQDGLIVERGYQSGLLLPQVPVEWKWDVKEFLEHTCQKAGLTRECWNEPETKIYRFQGQIFSE
jgi:uncharacterized protein (TIGR00296 family)